MIVRKIPHDDPTSSLYRLKTEYNDGSAACQVDLDERYLPALKAAGLAEK